MRIGIFTTGVSGGGAEGVAREWTSEFIARGWQVTYIVPDTTLNRRLANEFNIDCIYIAWKKSNVFKAVFELRKIISDYEIEVLLTLLTLPNLIQIVEMKILGGNKKCLRIISERNIPKRYANDHSLSDKIQYYLGKILYKYADGLVGLSPAVSSILTESFNADARKVFTVKNPANRQFGDKEMHKRHPSKPKIGLVSAGRFDIQKNYQLLFEVAQRMYELDILEKLEIYTSTERIDEFENICVVEDMNYLIIKDWNHHWFEDCDRDSIFCMFSKYEGFGNVLIEAASHGIPAVINRSALGSTWAVIDGLTGYSTVTSDVDEIVGKIIAANEIQFTSDVASWLSTFSSRNSVGELVLVIDELNSRRGF